MSKSFLPAQYAHPYEIDEKYSKAVAYFCMEYAIDNVFKIYSGGLGYLAGSHMRSAGALRQNLVGVGILWSYGYYNQIRAEDGSMAVQYLRKEYSFLEDHNIKFLIRICGAPVWVKFDPHGSPADADEEFDVVILQETVFLAQVLHRHGTVLGANLIIVAV